MTACSKCDRPIVWVTMATTGRPNPCDPEEIEIVADVTAPGVRPVAGIDPDGVPRRGHRVDGQVGQDAIAAAHAGGVEPAITRVRISHFATCLHAPSFRKAKP